ncbi:hypothetical protein FH609_019735 [Streptomyces sp. 3MP-14]|uniref:DUF4232 domain-containing protein n=1 Tax=Streptomyces mimosae TaxID=2586635 RepID=A0A5N6A506_9ACTN|nr:MULTISPECIES: hypothetical protein [Streptomyces]KAB8163874.1 hypothetical protein FH607_018275 [Streptomyces mimosae]KAB8175317.1 hypothetical protein FH609_019735 [Streptomyces sp. 3MP-14]
MGSLRTPVGPLPSAIYWRRRAVVLLLLAVVLLLVFWAVRSTGGGADPAGQDDGKGPAESITPGPTPSESLIEERPGGREDGDEDGQDDEGGEGDDAGGSDGEDDGGNGVSAGGDEGSAGSGGTDDGGNGESGGNGGGGGGVPDCDPSEVTLSLRSDANDYAPGQRPELRLTARNAGAASCQLDFGHQALMLTLADDEDNEVWSSADCPTVAAALPTVVSAGGTADHTVTWDLRHSVADCEQDQGPAASPGTYLAEAQLAGYPVAQTSFRLEAD